MRDSVRAAAVPAYPPTRGQPSARSLTDTDSLFQFRSMCDLTLVYRSVFHLEAVSLMFSKVFHVSLTVLKSD